MKKLLLAVLAIRASTALAQPGSPMVHITTPPVPPGQDIVALCPGEDPCPDDWLIAKDPVEDCWVCFDPTGLPGVLADCTGTGQEAIGPFFVGEGAVDPCDGCAGAGAGDIAIRGGHIYYLLDGLDEALLIAHCGSDDDSAATLAGGRTGSIINGGYVTATGNDDITEGDILCFSGDQAGSAAILRSHGTGGLSGAYVIQEDGATDNVFVEMLAGPTFTGNSGDDILVTDPLNAYFNATRTESVTNVNFDMAVNKGSAYFNGQLGVRLAGYSNTGWVVGGTTNYLDGNITTGSGANVTFGSGVVGEMTALGQTISLASEITGTLGSANGGTGINSSAITGDPVIDGGVWSAGTSEPLAQEARVFKSMLDMASTGLLAIQDTAYFLYLGQVRHSTTINFVEIYMVTQGTVSTVGEVGLFSTPLGPNKGNQTVTKIVATATIDTLTATPGMKRNTNPFAQAVAAGTHLWVGVRTANGGTEPTWSAHWHDDGQGWFLTTANAGALTNAGPWAGVVATPSLNPECPAMRATMD